MTSNNATPLVPDNKIGYFAILAGLYGILSYIPLYFLYQWIASIWWKKWDLLYQIEHGGTEVAISLIMFLILPGVLGILTAILTIWIWKRRKQNVT